jgi:hypothetical protein
MDPLDYSYYELMQICGGGSGEYYGVGYFYRMRPDGTERHKEH